ncbi:hypothetical protein [Comamonas serinivorans]|uniref:hypothetical protein n=1 Tax=Comamonas serinivorans TaxID=1082851 RepID=UPI00146C319D|nr:hypothetical protein [Comamonas serinivorans]
MSETFHHIGIRIEDAAVVTEARAVGLDQVHAQPTLGSMNQWPFIIKRLPTHTP